MNNVTWCLKKLEEALLDYGMEAAKNYLAMSRMWLGNYQRAESRLERTLVST